MTETQTESAAFDLDAYADSGVDGFTSKLWPQVKSSLDRMHQIKAELDRYSPPTPSELYKFVVSDKGQEDAQIKELHSKVKELQEAISTLQKRLNERALTLISPESLPPDELEKRRNEFGQLRTLVKDQLHLLSGVATTMGRTEVAEALNEVSIPNFTGGSASGTVRNPEVARLKEWAKQNGISVPERGRIPDSVWEQYRKSQENGTPTA